MGEWRCAEAPGVRLRGQSHNPTALPQQNRPPKIVVRRARVWPDVQGLNSVCPARSCSKARDIVAVHRCGSWCTRATTAYSRCALNAAGWSFVLNRNCACLAVAGGASWVRSRSSDRVPFPYMGGFSWQFQAGSGAHRGYRGSGSWAVTPDHVFSPLVPSLRMNGSVSYLLPIVFILARRQVFLLSSGLAPWN
jgi:hypothetical protein